MTGVGAQADRDMQVGREARQVGCLGDVQRTAVTHSAYGSTAQRSIHVLFALYMKW